MSPAASYSGTLAHPGLAPSRSRLARIAATVSLWVGLGACAGVLLSITVPSLLGYQVLTVLSGSMDPVFRAGDLIVDSRISPLDANVGDVVTFKDPDSAHLTTHRVRQIRVKGDHAYFATKGDQNNKVERWSIPLDGKIGRVEYRVPKLGYLTSWAGSPFGRLLLIVFPALLLGAFELRRIWRPAAKERTDDDRH